MGNKLSSSSRVPSSSSVDFTCSNVGNYSCDMSGYKTVEINGQVWMAENLNCDVKGSYCYNNKTENCNKYGRLYDWCTAMEVCQNGWHLPSNDEWQELVDFAGGKFVAGRYLKAKEGWYDNGNGEDKFGFAALPGGYGGRDGSFDAVVNRGHWWSSSTETDTFAYILRMGYDNEAALSDSEDKRVLFSVRCIQDQLSEPKLPE